MVGSARIITCHTVGCDSKMLDWVTGKLKGGFIL